MKHIIALILLSTISFSYVYGECGGISNLQYAKNLTKEPKKYKQWIVRPLAKLAKCGWIIDSKALVVTVSIYKDNVTYVDGFNYKYVPEKESLWIRNLHDEITKTVANELYFANLKYIDTSITREVLNNFKLSNKEMTNILTNRPIEFNVYITLDKYNDYSDLHYGNIVITVNRIEKKLWEYTTDLDTYTINKPIAGYINTNNVMKENILNSIKSSIRNYIRPSYNAYKNVLKNHEYTLNSTYDWRGNDIEEAKFVRIALNKYSDKLNIKINYEPIPDWYLKPIARTIVNKDNIIKEEVLNVFYKLYPYLYFKSYSNLNKIQKNIIDNAIIKVKKLKKIND